MVGPNAGTTRGTITPAGADNGPHRLLSHTGGFTVSATASSPAVDAARLEAFMGQMVCDMGACASAPLIILGERLGLYRALAQEGPLTSAQLAQATGCHERMVREWLATHAAAGYVEHDAATDTYTLPTEHALALADEDSPFFVLGGYDIMQALFADLDKLEQAFRHGGGLGWDQHDHRLFDGTRRFFRAGYEAHLVQEWIPALTGVQEKLERGASVADVGCGHGISTLVMARAFPASRFTGYDYHQSSIDQARALAAAEALDDRVGFERAAAKELPLGAFDLVCNFDCLHDMGDPVGAARRAYEALADDGTYFIVEPNAGDDLQHNINPVGRLFYAASTQVCTPASLAQEVGLALGAQAGERRLREVLEQAGFTRIRRAAETPFNMVLEARK
jgi:SAM-dependent methyltransferase